MGLFKQALFFGLVLGLAGCMTNYPRDESKLTFTYPLHYCNGDILAAAKARAAQSDAAAAPIDASVCVTQPVAVSASAGTDGSQRAQDLEQQAFSASEKQLRETLEAQFIVPRKGGERFGVALSGGGSKSSSFSMGVLAALSDEKLLSRTDYISTVSGGGYAAYFYYTHRIFPTLRSGNRERAANEDLFRDCVLDPESAATDAVQKRIASANHCRRLGLESISPQPEQRAEDIRYQAFVKCNQDVLRPGHCHNNTTAGPDNSISYASLGGTIALFPLSNIANTLFDWGYSTAPSARTYRDGIGLTYGATVPRNVKLDPEAINLAKKHCGDAREALGLTDCTANAFYATPVPMSFEELRLGILKSRQDAEALPFWIINATAPQSRSVFGWINPLRPDTSNSDMFEMTAVSHGSGRFGYVSASPAIHDMSVLDAVAAAAAFLDANQQTFRNPAARTLIGAGLHVANLDWGYDIANYNVSTQRRSLHRALPVPFYWLDGLIANARLPGHASAELRHRRDSAFIRLIDGGNSENLGVYSLLKRGVRNVLIADAAQDEDGKFVDICGLRRRLLNTPADILPRHLYLPGLQDFAAHCDAIEHKRFGYNMHGWLPEHPVLFGCIRHQEGLDGAEACSSLKGDEIRLFVVKPAINFPKFVRTQMGGNAKGLVSDCYVRGVDTLQADYRLNCDSAVYLKFNEGIEKGVTRGCPIFPQAGTARMTANSSADRYVAYRELARQYVSLAARAIRPLLDDEAGAAGQYEEIVRLQHGMRLRPTGSSCI